MNLFRGNWFSPLSKFPRLVSSIEEIAGLGPELIEGVGETDSPKTRDGDRPDGEEADRTTGVVVEVVESEEIMTEESASPGNPTLKSKLALPP